ncbi:MAG: DUF4924 family protein [Paludibacteraceae bacterium]|nr:DUF4924 family protein [Paludibacteraceae bacterium]
MLKSKKDNIAEYILYLWQIEDYLRAFPQQADTTAELHELNEMMHREGITEKGHLQLAQNALTEMEELHAQLLDEDAMYRAAVIRLQPGLNLLKAKTDRPTMSDIEACLTLLYQIMLLRLQKKEISPQTSQTQTQATNLLRFLSQNYRHDDMTT